MNNLNSNALKHIVFSSLLGLLAAAAAYFFPMALMLMPALIGYGCVAWGVGAPVVAIGVSSFIVFGALGMDIYSLGLLMMFVPGSIAIAITLMRKGSYRAAVAACAVFAAAGMYIFTCLPAVLDGLGPFDYYIQYAEEMGRVIIENMPEMGLDGSERTVSEFVARLKITAPSATMLVFTVFGLGSGMLDVIISKKLCDRKKIPVKPMAPMHMWQLSRSFITGAIFLAIGTVVVTYLNLNNAAAVTVVVAAIICCGYSLMGLCFLIFGMKVKKRSKGGYVLLIVLMVLLLPFSIYGLAVMGAADRLFRIRERYAGA